MTRTGYRVTIACPQCGATVERTLTLAPLAAHGQCERCWPWEPNDEAEANLRTMAAFRAIEEAA